MNEVVSWKFREGELTLSLQLFLVQFGWLLSFVFDGVSGTKLCEWCSHSFEQISLVFRETKRFFNL